MSAWTKDELDEISAADELELAAVRSDGTLRNPVTMWVVRNGDHLYVRSVNGRGSSWFRGAQARHEAHIRAGGVEKDVDLVETDDVNDEVDTAYRTKYGRRYPSIVPSIVAPEPRAATLKLVPH
jgi:hypothetical protein